MNGPSVRHSVMCPALFALVVLIYALELGIDVMDVDSAQYAHLAEEMWRTKSFLVVHNRGADYLDKPPLTFWLAASSFALFGVSTWAYKLPSLLAALIAVFSTWRLTRLLQPDHVARAAALMLATTLAMFMWTNDVRTDTVLLGAVTFATWQLAESLTTGRSSSFWLGWVGISAALLAKGPIGAFVPLVAVGAQAAWQRRWDWLLRWRWLGGALLCLLLLAPMLAGLYQQFGARGPAFFFWTQSFGRITGESSWRDSTTPLFFTHTLLWELLPWTPLFVFGLIHDGRVLWRRQSGEVLSLAGFAIPFVALSSSHYKLPHYIFVTLPFACIISASQAARAVASERFRSFLAMQLLIVAALWLLLSWIAVEVFPLSFGMLMVLLGGAAIATVALALPVRERWVRLVGPSFATISGLALLLALHFYPTLLTYQASSMAAHLLHERGVPADRVRTAGPTSYALDFLMRTSVPPLDPAERAHSGELWIFTDEAGRDALMRSGRVLTEVSALWDYPVTRWSFAFFRPASRSGRLQRRFLLRMEANAP